MKARTAAISEGDTLQPKLDIHVGLLMIITLHLVWRFCLALCSLNIAYAGRDDVLPRQPLSRRLQDAPGKCNGATVGYNGFPLDDNCEEITKHYVRPKHPNDGNEGDEGNEGADEPDPNNGDEGNEGDEGAAEIFEEELRDGDGENEGNDDATQPLPPTPPPPGLGACNGETVGFNGFPLDENCDEITKQYVRPKHPNDGNEGNEGNEGADEPDPNNGDEGNEGDEGADEGGPSDGDGWNEGNEDAIQLPPPPPGCAGAAACDTYPVCVPDFSEEHFFGLNEPYLSGKPDGIWIDTTGNCQCGTYLAFLQIRYQHATRTFPPMASMHIVPAKYARTTCRAREDARER